MQEDDVPNTTAAADLRERRIDCQLGFLVNLTAPACVGWLHKRSKSVV